MGRCSHPSTWIWSRRVLRQRLWHLLLSKKRSVWGIDGSKDAVRLAEECFRTPRAMFSVGYFPFELPTAAFDFIVSLESVEHVSDSAGFLSCIVQALKP